MKQKKLLIINQQQFGYHSDTYYYCRYLRNLFNITYICWGYNRKKINLSGINIIYISRNGNLALRNARFIFEVIKEIKKDYHFHIIKYFRGCSLLKIVCPGKKFLFDIRSGSVKSKKKDRLIYNFLIKAEAKFFKNISVISESLAKKLGFSETAYILPLGADIISPKDKKFNSLELLYVGTIDKRNIDQTIKGFSKFYREYKEKIPIKYTIVGGGFGNEEQQLKELVKHEGLDTPVKVLGHIPHDEIKSFFDSHNIGISYVPQTEYYDVQPATKNFEYLLSGMPVIATATLENKAVINSKNGIIINDTPEDFYTGLVMIHKNLQKYNSKDIRQASMQYTWKIIVDDLNSKIHSLI